MENLRNLKSGLSESNLFDAITECFDFSVEIDGVSNDTIEIYKSSSDELIAALRVEYEIVNNETVVNIIDLMLK